MCDLCKTTLPSRETNISFFLFAHCKSAPRLSSRPPSNITITTKKHQPRIIQTDVTFTGVSPAILPLVSRCFIAILMTTVLLAMPARPTTKTLLCSIACDWYHAMLCFFLTIQQCRQSINHLHHKLFLIVQYLDDAYSFISQSCLDDLSV